MIKVILVSAFISGCLAATTMKPHHSHASHASHGHHTHGVKPTHEPDVHHGYQFHYDHSTHMIVMRVGHKCYLHPMDAQQQMDIHTAHGLVTIEKMLIDKLDMGTQTTMVSHDDLMAMGKGVAKYCGHSQAFQFM
uniref:Uncharacterized protein n=1 Tax=Pinctada fucata TaxID=50426 RepID=A0A194AKH3_PINFU